MMWKCKNCGIKIELFDLLFDYGLCAHCICAYQVIIQGKRVKNAWKEIQKRFKDFDKINAIINK